MQVIPAGMQTAVLNTGRGTLRFLNIQDREENPCRDSVAYKGVREPLCPCRPCLSRYLNHQRERGRQVVFLPYHMREIFSA
jgi:hypothetical protein